MPDDHDIHSTLGWDDVRRTLVYRQAVRECGDPERAVRMAEDFDAAMRSLVTSTGTSAEEMDALKAGILALVPVELREYEEWKRRHPVTWRLRSAGSLLLRRFP